MATTTDRDPLLDAIDCAECNKEFIPKHAGQTLCGRPACNGGIGARKRVYGKKGKRAEGKPK